MYVNPIIKQTTQEFDQNRKIKFTQEKNINVKVWTLILKKVNHFHVKRDKNKFEKQDAKWTPWSPEISTIPKFKI